MTSYAPAIGLALLFLALVALVWQLHRDEENWRAWATSDEDGDDYYDPSKDYVRLERERRERATKER